MPFLSPNSSTPLFPGQIVVHQGGDIWLPYNQATNVGGDIGMSMTPAAIPGNPFTVLTVGDVPINVVSLGAGQATTVIAGLVPSRGNAGNQIGYCDLSGRITLIPSQFGNNLTTGQVANPAISSTLGLPGQALVVNNAGTNYTPQGVETAANLRAFGAKGDGIADDTAAVQAWVNSLISPGAVGFAPAGVYKITSTITINISLTFQSFRIKGALMDSAENIGCTFKWFGAAGGIMFDLQGGEACIIEHMLFDGGGLAGCCFRNSANGADGNIYKHCYFTNPESQVAWLPSTPYTTGTIVAGWRDVGHYFQAQNNGTSGTTTPVWVVTSGGTTTEGTMTWKEIRTSAACFIAGTTAGTQVGNLSWINCRFLAGVPAAPLQSVLGGSNSAGLRLLGGNNVKNFKVDFCEFSLCGRGIDWALSSGTLLINYAAYSQNAETDVYMDAGGSLTMVGNESEGSSVFVAGIANANWGSMVLTGCNFAGGHWLYGHGPYFGAVLVAGVSTCLIGCDFLDGTNNISLISVPALTSTGSSNIQMFGNWFIGATDWGFLLDTGVNQLLNSTATANSSPGELYRNEEIAVFGRGNYGGSGSGSLIRLPDIDGGQLRSNRQQLNFNGPNNELPAGTVVHEYGCVGGHWFHMEFPKAAWTSSGTSQTLMFGSIYGPYIIHAIIVKVSSAGIFSGLTNPKISIGRFNGTTTCLLSPFLVSSAVTKGGNTGEYGSDFTAAGPVGVLIDGVGYPTNPDFITITLTSGNAISTNIGANATVHVWVLTSILP